MGEYPDCLFIAFEGQERSKQEGCRWAYGYIGVLAPLPWIWALVHLFSTVVSNDESGGDIYVRVLAGTLWVMLLALTAFGVIVLLCLRWNRWRLAAQLASLGTLVLLVVAAMLDLPASDSWIVALAGVASGLVLLYGLGFATGRWLRLRWFDHGRDEAHASHRRQLFLAQLVGALGGGVALGVQRIDWDSTCSGEGDHEFWTDLLLLDRCQSIGPVVEIDEVPRHWFLWIWRRRRTLARLDAVAARARRAVDRQPHQDEIRRKHDLSSARNT